MNNNNLNFELVQMRQIRFENDMMKRAIHALLDSNLKTNDDIKKEDKDKVLTDKDDILSYQFVRLSINLLTYLFVSLSISQSIYLSICLLIFLSIYKSIFPPFHLSVQQGIHLSTRQYVYLHI